MRVPDCRSAAQRHTGHTGVADRKIGGCDCDGDDIERGRSRAGIISRKGDKRPAGASLSSKIV
jgi:hypothetical protein